MKSRFLQVVALSLSILGLAQGRSLTPQVEDSLHAIHPRLRAHWLKERGIDVPGYTSPFQPESLNMRCVGRWSYGPSYDVTGRITDHDTTVYMARGSGVSVLQFHGGSQPSVTLLSDINATGLVRRVVMQDSWLFVGTSGIEIYNVSQPTNPVKVSWTNATNNDLAVLGNYLYTTSNDSFKVFNISDKTSPSLVGAVRDSGSTVAVANGKAYLLWNTYGWGGMYILDVSNPQSPHRVGIWNGTLGSVAARGNLCYASDAGRFHILDMTNPASPQELSSVGVGGSVYVNGNFAYLSTFAVIDIMDSLSPGIVGQCSAGGDAVWTTGDYGYGFPLTGGLAIVDYPDPVHPRADTIGILGYDASYDISVQGNHAVVANNACGIRILNVADPAHPFESASFDTATAAPYCKAASAVGPLVYMGWVELLGDLAGAVHCLLRG